MAAKGASLNHVSRESSDITRLSQFYKDVLGFEELEAPNFGEFKVIWLGLPSSSFAMHLIERSPETRLPEGPYSAASPTVDPKYLPRGHHVCFSVSNFESFVQVLKDKGIETFQRSLPNGKVKQVFFFDPDGKESIAYWREHHHHHYGLPDVDACFFHHYLQGMDWRSLVEKILESLLC